MKNKRNWSDYVTKNSFALDLEEGVFTWDEPRKIAASLKKSAELSSHRKVNQRCQCLIFILIGPARI